MLGDRLDVSAGSGDSADLDLTPSAFSEVYWEANFLKVYTADAGWVPPSSAVPSVPPAASTSSVSKLTSNAQGRPTTPTMSLAGTTPTGISGSFSATSSALSVISSLSTASEASVSSSLATAETSPPALPSTSLPFTSLTSPESVPTQLTPFSPSSSPPPEPLPAPSTAPAVEVVTLVTIVVQETVTVYPTPTVHDHHARERLHQLLDSSSTPSNTSESVFTTVSSTGINKYGNCSFAVPQATTVSVATDYVCTFTKLGVMAGRIYTNRITFSTPIPPATGLTLWTFLTIDTISLQTQTLSGAALGATFTAVTGSFTPTASSVSSTVLTGYPAAAGPTIPGAPPVAYAEV